MKNNNNWYDVLLLRVNSYYKTLYLILKFFSKFMRRNIYMCGIMPTI